MPTIEKMQTSEARSAFTEMLHGVALEAKVYVITMQGIPLAQLCPLSDEVKAELSKPE